MPKKSKYVIQHKSKYIGVINNKPRLCVFKSNKHTYSQLINDALGHTICAHSTQNSGRPVGIKSRGNLAAYWVGNQIAKKITEKNVGSIVFDRRQYRFFGRVAQVARGARDGGALF